MVKTKLQICDNDSLRIALFADTFFEANGVGTLSRQLAEFAKGQNFPFLVVRGGDETKFTRDGSLETLELRRSAAAFPIDKTLYFDPLLMRHKQLVIDHLQRFEPDLIHLTGPGDIGFLAVRVAHELNMPSVASWHTNAHEYLARRMQGALSLLPGTLCRKATGLLERETLRGMLRFYRSARFTLAPNQAMVDVLHERTRRPSYLMLHGVDLTRYRPLPQEETDRQRGRPFCIGYVGRLTTEKNVRVLAEIEQRLIGAGEKNYQFLIVGEGGQERWLRRHLQRAKIAGVLRGDDLAAAYRRMDVLVFPSLTDTFGLVILEAMASGVPVILSPETGRRAGVVDGVSGFLSEDFAADVQRVMNDACLRKSMGEAAQSFAKTQGWDMVFRELYRTYAEGLRTVEAGRQVRAFQ